MALQITSSDGTPIPIEIIGLDVLALAEDEKKRFLATFQTYLQQLYHQGFVNFRNVEIRGRFLSGRSGAVVFPIMLFTPGLDPAMNHYRVLKYDDTTRVAQEAIRFNSLVSQRTGESIPYEEIHWFSSQAYPVKSLLSYRDLLENVRDLKEVLTCIVELASHQTPSDLKEEICQALRDVLGTLYHKHYCTSLQGLPRVSGWTNRKVSEIFAEIFPAEREIVEQMPDASDGQEYNGFLVGIRAVSDTEYRKRYVLKDDAEDRFIGVDLITQNVTMQEISDFLNSSIEQRCEYRIRGQVTKSCSLQEHLKASVASSSLPAGMIDADKLYRGLQYPIELPYWAFHLHHDLNPGNILVVKKADGDVQGKVIDYYSFGPGGHLFTDVARLEALMLLEYLLRVWDDLFRQHDYAALQAKTKSVEKALFLLNSQQPELSQQERDIVDIALEIRRISLNWLANRDDTKNTLEMSYRNYLFARYAFLLAFQKYSSDQGANVPEKKQLVLLCADALLELIEGELRNLHLAQLLADLNGDVFIDDDDVHEAETFRKTRETALLVMMCIDMVNSTHLREELGEFRFNNLLDEKKAEMTAIIEREKTGKVIKDLGDGLLAVLAVTDVAVQRALEIQETLASHPIFKVRIGLDMGQVTQETEQGIVKDVFGRQVNRAARLEALCAGEHVLVSYPMWDSARGWLKHVEHIRWKKHGCYRLKGIEEPQVVYEPYNNNITTPLDQLKGEHVPLEEAFTYCTLCGRYVKLMETFKCRTCGKEGICGENFDQEHGQCSECISASTKRDIPPNAQKIIDLQNSESSFAIKIWTEHSEKRGTTRDMLVVPKKGFGNYKIGDKVVAYFQSSVDAFVYMLNIGPTGNITHIFPPNEYAADNHVSGGRQYTFPAADAEFEWILQEPAGVETIKVLATKVPVEIEVFLAEECSKPAIRDIGVRPKVAKTLSPDQWVEASCTLLVQK